MRSSFLTFFSFCILSFPTVAADWPQWRGPNRDGISKETGLLQSWPKGGPKLLWTYQNNGIGFNTPAVVGDRLYTMGAREEQTYVICLDISGNEPKEVWEYKVGPIFTFKGNTYGDGPRSTPTVAGDHVYALTGDSDLVCLTTKDGKEVWKTNLKEKLGGVVMTEWGFSESVLIDGDKLICTPGGPQGTLAAFNKKTGEVLWRSKELKDKATHASVMSATIGGVPQYILTTYVDDIKGTHLAGVAAKDGKLLWYQPLFRGSAGYGVCNTPVVKENSVYVTSVDGGCNRVEINKAEGKFAVKSTYGRRDQRNMKNNHGGVVLVDGHIYGHAKRFGWVCLDWKTGKVVWEGDFTLPCRSGSLIAAGDRLYLYSDEGTAVLIHASPKGWKEEGRFTLPMKSKVPENRVSHRQTGIWTHPIIANGRLYLRDQEYLFCYDIKK